MILIWDLTIRLIIPVDFWRGQYVLPATPEDSARTSLEPTALTSYTAVNCLAVSVHLYRTIWRHADSCIGAHKTHVDIFFSC